MPIAPFTKAYQFFDTHIINVAQTGSAKMIALITPLLSACFGLYLLIILASYWRGDNEEPVIDFLLRMAGWGIILAFGLNINYYVTYVIPFFNGLGDELASVVSTKSNTAVALDAMVNGYLEAFTNLYMDANGLKESIFAILMIVVIGIFAGLFMLISIGYIVLAKLALGVLLAIGPLFICAALFPATRQFLNNWIGQCLNYAFLVLLFSFIAQAEISMVSTLIPSSLTFSDVAMTIIICALFIFVSLNLPGLASQLAGGVGISSMVRKLPKPSLPKKGNKDGVGPGQSGGELKGASGPEK